MLNLQFREVCRQRRLTAFVILLLFTTAGAFAQGRQQGTPEEQQARFEQQTNEMMTALELTTEQKPGFLEIMQAANSDRNDLMSEMRAGGDRSTMREKMMKLNDTTTKALSSLLTEDQMVKYKEIVSARSQRRGRPQS